MQPGVTAVFSDRNVLHVNIANFYVAVARVLTPRLRGYPVGVATAGAQRRVLLDVSSEAREAGLYRGMLLERAKRRCPDLVVLSPMPEAYRRAGKALVGEAAGLSPRVEPAGPGHVFVDLTGTARLFGSSLDIADRLHKSLWNSYRLPSTVGLGSSKMVSKVATRVIKPEGLCRVEGGCEEEFMAPLPITFLPGVDPSIVRRLVQFNLRLIKDLHLLSAEQLARALGAVAFDICRFAHGIDPAPVRELRQPEPLIEEAVIFEEQTNDERVIRRKLRMLVERAGMRVRHMALSCGTLVLAITYSDGLAARRTTRLPTPLSGDLSLFERFAAMLTSACTRRIRLASMRIALRDLSSPYGQMDLFVDTQRETDLMGALDGIRRRFGMEAVRFGGAG